MTYTYSAGLIHLRTPMHTTPTIITEAFRFVAVYSCLKRNVKVTLMAYTAIAYSGLYDVFQL